MWKQLNYEIPPYLLIVKMKIFGTFNLNKYLCKKENNMQQESNPTLWQTIKSYFNVLPEKK